MKKPPNRLKEVRVAAGWSQSQLAAACGVSQQAIANIEGGKHGASMRLAMAIVTVLGLGASRIPMIWPELDSKVIIDGVRNRRR